MTSRKIKHARTMAKREKFFAQLKADNARVLEQDRERRRQEEWAAWEENHNKRHTTPEKRIQECPHCRQANKGDAMVAGISGAAEKSTQLADSFKSMAKLMSRS